MPSARRISAAALAVLALVVTWSLIVNLQARRETENAYHAFALEQKEKVHQRKHTALTELFRTLLHQLMTAQIRVRDL